MLKGMKRLFKRAQATDLSAELASVVDAFSDLTCLTDDQGIIRVLNRTARDKLAAQTGKSISTVIQLITSAATTADIWQITAENPGGWSRNELTLVAPDGSRIPVNVTVAPVEHPPARFIFILRDISDERLRAERKEDFVAVVTHELRTPLAVAEANLSTALLPKLGQMNPEARDLLEQTHQNLRFMAELVRDLSLTSQAERGTLPLDLRRLQPGVLMRAIASDFAAQAADRHLAFLVKPAPGLPELLTSEYRVHEILQNLVSNALKYTPKGKITIAAQAKDGGILFSVQDTGIGIAASDKERLFNKFYRSADQQVRRLSGTGLGLYISHHLAADLNARLWFTSRLGRGTTFYLLVPQYHTSQKVPTLPTHSRSAK